MSQLQYFKYDKQRLSSFKGSNRATGSNSPYSLRALFNDYAVNISKCDKCEF